MVGHAQVHAPEWREERAMDLVVEPLEEVLAEIRTDDAVMDAAARVYAPALVAPEGDAFQSVVVGVDVDVESGSYGLLSGLDEDLKQGHVLIGYRLARKVDAKIGQEIAIVGQAADGSIANDLYIIQDIINCPVDLINQMGVVMGIEDAQELFVMYDQAHEIVIRTKQSGQAESLVSRLSAKGGMKGLEILPWQEIVPELIMILKVSDYTIYFILILVLIAAIAGIANTLMMSTFERMHEFGMLLALGSRPMRLVKMIMIEAVLLGALGVMLGTGFGYAFVGMTSDSGIDMASWGGDGQVEEMAYKGLQIPVLVFPRLEPLDPIIGLIAVVLTALVAAVWPSMVAARLEPMEAMRA